MKKNQGINLLALLLAIAGIIVWLFLPILYEKSNVGGLEGEASVTGMALIFGGKAKASAMGISFEVEAFKMSIMLCVAFGCACFGALIILIKSSGAAKRKILPALVAFIALVGAAVMIFLTKQFAVLVDGITLDLEELDFGIGAYIAMGCLALSGIIQLVDIK